MPSLTKTCERFETFLELLSVVIFYAELKVEISDILLSFHEVVLLELRFMMSSTAADDSFCKLEIDALIFSE